MCVCARVHAPQPRYNLCQSNHPQEGNSTPSATGGQIDLPNLQGHRDSERHRQTQIRNLLQMCQQTGKKYFHSFQTYKSNISRSILQEQNDNKHFF